MKEKGLTAGFLVSKISVAFAVVFLIGSALAMHESFDRKSDRERLEVAAEKVAVNLRKVDSLPGEIRLERELPSLELNYELILSGSKQDCQVVNIRAQGEGEHPTNSYFSAVTVTEGNSEFPK